MEWGATQGDYTDWPDLLANRLAGEKQKLALAVINEGIGGNRILHDGAGVSALARFDRDVLAQPGVVSMIVLEGINDIGWPHMKPKLPDGTIMKEPPLARELVTTQVRNHGVSRPKSLDFLKSPIWVWGVAYQYRGMDMSTRFSEVRFGDHRQYFSRGQFHIHRRR